MRINPKQLERAMKKLGIQATPVDAEEVIIRTPTKEIIITNPEVSKVSAFGQETFQITGTVTEKERSGFTEEDIKIIVDQTGASPEEARKTLEKTKDIAEAILKLKEKQTNIG